MGWMSTVGNISFRYHVPDTHNPGDPPARLLLTVEGETEEVADYMGRAHLCDMATLGYWLTTCPGRRGRLARWIVQRAMSAQGEEGEYA